MEQEKKDIFHRVELLLGSAQTERLSQVRVLLFGTGGVGSWCAECLIRSGVRHLTMVDFDRVCASNCNRQLMAMPEHIGKLKVEVLRERLLQINPDARIEAIAGVFNADTADQFHLEQYDFVLDAIDSVRDKAELILRATSLPSTTLISSMGAALRIDPTKVRSTEFWKIKGDGLARALRNHFKRYKRFPARKFECIYSEETPLKNQIACPESEQANGSLCQVTAVFGMVMASKVINHS